MDTRPPRNIILDMLDGQGVLFSEPDQRLFLLDAVAAMVWQDLWVKSVSRQDLAHRLSNICGCSSDEAEGYIAACLSQWEAEGLIGTREQATIQAWPSCPPATAVVPDGEVDVFCLAGLRFAISCPDAAVSDAVRDVFGHLRTASTEFADFTLVIRKTAEGYLLVRPDRTESSLTDGAAVAVSLKTDVLDMILSVRPEAIALHAAALLAPNGPVLLAGSSGSGKTTLAAVLNARGWALIADDVALVRDGNSPIGGLPLAYAVKPGSWPVLRDYFRELDELRTYRRPDGRVVKYIAPRTTSSSENAPVKAVVFPHYRPAGPVDARPLDRVAALVMLLEEARNARHHLTCDGFLALNAILRNATVLELHYSDAVRAADTLIHMGNASERPADQ